MKFLILNDMKEKIEKKNRNCQDTDNREDSNENRPFHFDEILNSSESKSLVEIKCTNRLIRIHSF